MVSSKACSAGPCCGVIPCTGYKETCAAGQAPSSSRGRRAAPHPFCSLLLPAQCFLLFFVFTKRPPASLTGSALWCGPAEPAGTGHVQQPQPFPTGATPAACPWAKTPSTFPNACVHWNREKMPQICKVKSKSKCSHSGLHSRRWGRHSTGSEKRALPDINQNSAEECQHTHTHTKIDFCFG